MYSYARLTLFIIVFLFAGPLTVFAVVTPELPRIYVDTTYQAHVSGTCSVTIQNGGNVQAAIDAATQTSNYVICLQAGGTFNRFILRNKTGNEWITIRTSTPDANLPASGSRINSSHTSLLAKIKATDLDTVISTQSGAHNYRLIGLEVTSPNVATQNTAYNLIGLGDSYTDTSEGLLPRDIIIDRSYIHGTPTGNVRRGVALNGRRLAVIDSYISDIHEIGADTQAIAAWSGAGPLKIVNNYLEAAGENLMLGGASPAFSGSITSDVEIRNNHFFKPLSWKQDDPSYAGIRWSVKNLIEFKSAQRVLINGNVFENIWYAVQRGGAVVITPRRGLSSLEAVTDDLTFTDNIFKNIDEVVAISGFDDYDPLHGGSAKRILFQNNLFDMTAAFTNCCTYQIILSHTTRDVEFNHNTFIDKKKTGSSITIEGDPVSNITFTNNIIPQYTYGIAPNVTPVMCVNCVINKNIFADHDSYYTSAAMELTRPGNFFPGPWSLVGMIDKAGGNYRLSANSVYKNTGTDGKDPGADLDAVNAATAYVISGGENTYIPPVVVPPPAPTPTPSPVVLLPTIDKTSASFGSFSVGSTSSEVMFTISNPGNSFVGISSVSISGDFSIKTNYCNSGTQPNTHCDVYVTFKPTTSGTRNGAITFSLTGTTQTTLSAALTGTGIAVPVTTTPTTPTTPVPSPTSTPISPTAPIATPIPTPIEILPIGSTVKNPPKGPKLQRTLARGTTSSDVILLQTYLKEAGFLAPSVEVTSYFGPLTEAAVKQFQVSQGIETTGTVGPLTRASISSDEPSRTLASIPTAPVTSTPSSTTFPMTLSIGMKNTDVVKLQNILKRLGFFPQTVASSGQFGPTTKKAVQAFQRTYNIASSGTENTTGYGMVGKKTWAKLLSL